MLKEIKEFREGSKITLLGTEFYTSTTLLENTCTFPLGACVTALNFLSLFDGLSALVRFLI